LGANQDETAFRSSAKAEEVEEKEEQDD